MSFLDRYKTLRGYGNKLGRAGMSERVIKAVSEFDQSYKGAMILAGRLKAIAQMAKADDYWDEQVQKGYAKELNEITSQAPGSELTNGHN